ncbi:MAG: helicase associated domain-containing protein, partial [Bacteroidota bacterium]|nr:helicase associated domain-containing protein [Bacteroidota bacterium]
MESLEQALLDTSFTDNWYRQFYKLEAYLTQEKNNYLLALDSIDSELINWINIQHKIRTKLPAELKAKLASLNFDFNKKDSFWEFMYHQLLVFAQNNGHTQLPPEDKRYEALRDWLLRQIQNKKYLPETRFQKLDALGIDWESASTRNQKWEQMYLRLVEFQKTYGHTQVPQNWEEDKSLANWVHVQRNKKAHNRILPEREQKLN